MVFLSLDRGMGMGMGEPWYGYAFKSLSFHHYRKENQQKSFTNYVNGNLTLVWTRELIITQVWDRILMLGSGHK